MECWKTSVRAYLGTAIRGLGWRYHPATSFVPFTVPKENSPGLNSSAAALPGTST